MYLRDQIRHDFVFWKFLFAFQDLPAAGFELCEELLEVNTQMRGAVVVEIAPAAVIELDRPASVAVAEVVQADGDLDQPLVELPRRALVIDPQLFPNFVRFVEVALVEVLDALQ